MTLSSPLDLGIVLQKNMSNIGVTHSNSPREKINSSDRVVAGIATSLVSKTTKLARDQMHNMAQKITCEESSLEVSLLQAKSLNESPADLYYNSKTERSYWGQLSWERATVKPILVLLFLACIAGTFAVTRILTRHDSGLSLPQ